MKQVDVCFCKFTQNTCSYKEVKKKHSEKTKEIIYINGSLINTVNGSKLSTEGFSKETGAAGWRHAVVSLQPFKSAPYIQLAFLSQIAKVGNAVMIDNIKIENNPELSVDGIITEKTEEKMVYDINGIEQNAGKLHKGLYITGGKKIVIK